MFGMDPLNTIWQSNLNIDLALTTNGGNLRFGSAVSATHMILNTAGNVGIGTPAPSSRLHVNGGDVRVSGGAFIDDGVTLNAPDYVFEPGYEPMTLVELEAFVRHERHLPNVPSAADIKSNGLNLSQFQMRLLEKVEELTLYAIQLNQQLEERDRRIASLSSAQSELERRLGELERSDPD
jgi:hypothetical protein